MACARGVEAAPRAEGCRRQARRVQRGDPQRRARRVPSSARDRSRIGRCLSGAPGARLSRRLHLVAGAVAQIAGEPLGWSRAVGRAASDLRARSRGRGVSSHANTGRSRSSSRPKRATASPRNCRISTARSSTASISTAKQRRVPPPTEFSPRAGSMSPLSSIARSGAIRSRPSRHRRCSRRPRASSALARRARCRSRSGFTRASISTATRSA